MSKPSIGPMSFVTAHLTLLLEDGSVADSTKAAGQPTHFRLGNDSLSPAIEQALIGLELGQRHQFDVVPEQAFGLPSPDNIRYMDVSEFPAEMALEPGLIIAFAGINGQEHPGLIREINGTSVKVDLNHPLAGHVVTFDVEILGIE